MISIVMKSIRGKDFGDISDERWEMKDVNEQLAHSIWAYSFSILQDVWL